MPFSPEYENREWDDLLYGFMSAVRHCRDVQSMREILESSLRKLGFPYVSYHVSYVKDIGNYLPYAITNYPEKWVDHYISSDYLSRDPVVQSSSERVVPFFWNSILLDSNADRNQKKLFDEARDFCIFDGFSIPIQGGRGEYAVLSVIPDASERNKVGLVESRKHILHLMALSFDQSARSILINCKLSGRRSRPLLTEREQDVLRWTSLGKTSADIADILGISRKGIEFHIDNIKGKLGVYSKTHAVVKAMVMGLI